MKDSRRKSRVKYRKLLHFLRPRIEELEDVIFNSPQLQAEAWKQITAKSPSKTELRLIMKYVPSLRIRAWRRLRTESLTNSELIWVIRHFKAFGEVAGERLLKADPTDVELGYIIQWVPGCRRWAGLKLFGLSAGPFSTLSEMLEKQILRSRLLLKVVPLGPALEAMLELFPDLRLQVFSDILRTMPSEEATKFLDRNLTKRAYKFVSKE